MYQALYRKYRPIDFSDVVGQDIIVKTLLNSLKLGNINHAYLFTGPRGTGKTSIAKILAKSVNCENLVDGVACNKCVNCTQNINKNHVDVIEIDAASNNGVDEIRELRNKVNLVPSLGKYKIYIIDEVHMLTTGAFNALLKTLEEPPKHAIFILATTEPQKIPLTILSRCQRFDFKKISNNCIFKYCVSESLPEYLYGDDLHLKQTIISLINFLNNGKQCIIDFDVSTITRYNICRLIITIHCSSYTISLQDINKILESSDNITKNEIENINLEDYKADLKVIKQIINFLGGTLLIKSDKECGTEFKIIINQMIYEDTKNNKLLSYEYTNKKRILIVDSNLKELNSLTKQMRNYNFIVTSTLYPNELISKLKSKEKYDLVFINDDLNDSSAVKVIKQLENINLKDTKIIVMLNKNKEHIKNHYLTEYKFYDYLLKNDYDNEINRILTKLKW